ncbi:monocyte to macrophage differentiation factor 2 [Sabethes cyaneus]|uniref:monocyte to macrophage differentiation factor 2 n=1 Tax=Sabethes cyaneus TaxID=53552 RepID=UPI00237EB7F2|nr:monocyte to macrophage differentiation factor 2 [Sabethes cyaneus]
MQDGITARHGATMHGGNPSACGNGNIHNGESTAAVAAQQRYTTTYSSAKQSPASSSPVKKSPSSAPSSPSHHFHSSIGSNGAGCNGEFKLCGYEGGNEESIAVNGTLISGSGTSPAEFFGALGFWLKLRHDLTNVPWEQLRAVRMKNPRAAPGCAYIPTEIEHIANVMTHGAWVLPSMYAGVNLVWRSNNGAQTLAAIIYGVALAMLFFVSTIFHCVFYCNRNRPLKDVLHRCDRAMIYIFIAGSYYPWLSLGHTSHPEIVSVVKWCVWLMAILGIVYQQMFHERYKCLETLFYIIIGLGPSLVIIFWGHEFTGMPELKFGGLLYIIGIVFFKSDGLFPFAHAIWHLFVVFAAGVHYFAILTHLYPIEEVSNT